MSELGDRIRDIRFDRGYTLREVASRLGVSLSFVSDLEHGRRLVPIHRAREWARCFGEPSGTWVRLAVNDHLERNGSDIRVSYLTIEQGRS